MQIRITPNRQDFPTIGKLLLTLKIEFVGDSIERDFALIELLKKIDVLRENIQQSINSQQIQ